MTMTCCMLEYSMQPEKIVPHSSELEHMKILDFAFLADSAQFPKASLV